MAVHRSRAAAAIARKIEPETHASSIVLPAPERCRGKYIFSISLQGCVSQEVRQPGNSTQCKFGHGNRILRNFAGRPCVELNFDPGPRHGIDTCPFSLSLSPSLSFSLSRHTSRSECVDVPVLFWVSRRAKSAYPFFSSSSPDQRRYIFYGIRKGGHVDLKEPSYFP